MILGFKPRFAPLVQDGSKTHTIRDDSHNRWKVGNWVDAFGKTRQPGMYRLTPRVRCVRVETIELRMMPDEKIMGAFWVRCFIEGLQLDAAEADLLAWRDGFRFTPSGLSYTGTGSYSMDAIGCFGLMVDYWRNEKPDLPYVGKIIYWR